MSIHVEDLIYKYCPTGFIGVFPLGPLFWKLIENKIVDPGYITMSDQMQLRISVEVMDSMMSTHDSAIVIRSILRSYLPNVPWEAVAVHVRQRVIPGQLTEYGVKIIRDDIVLEFDPVYSCAEFVDEQKLAKIVLAVG